MKTTILKPALEVVGAALLVIAVALVWPPAAVALAGVFCVAAGAR